MSDNWPLDEIELSQKTAVCETSKPLEFKPGRQSLARFRSDQGESEANGCSITVDFREKGFYPSYTLQALQARRAGATHEGLRTYSQEDQPGRLGCRSVRSPSEDRTNP